VLRLTVDELGRATASSRCICQLAPNGRGVSTMIEWDRGDTRPLGLQPPTPVARRVFTAGRPVVVADRRELDDPELAAYLESVESLAVVGYPITWRGRVYACLGFQDSRPRSWHDHALPLLERCDAQLAAALVQAELFEQQQRALDELRNLTRMREELIVNVSHELRTPLAAMLGSIKTLRRLDLDEATRADLLLTLDEQSDRLVRLTEDLLDLSRFQRGIRRLDRARLPLSELVRRARTEIVLPGGRTLHVRIDDDPELDVDANRMLQVLSNLLVNAVRHGAGDVHLRTFSEDGDAVVHVSDDGGGIEDGYEDEVFMPFAHRSDRSDSTGIGLSIARSIVEAHGGHLVYLPPTELHRHQFVVSLPRAAPG
jgi:signal transduction histidine kinase